MSYYLKIVLDTVGVTNSTTQLVFNGVLQICNAIVATGQCFFVDRIGRRTLFLVSTAGMLVCFIVWTICSAQFNMRGDPGAGKAVIVMIFICKFYLFPNPHFLPLLNPCSSRLRFLQHCMVWLALRILCRNPTIPHSRQRNDCHVPLCRPRSLLQLVCQSHCSQEHWLEILHCLLRLAGLRARRRVEVLHRDSQHSSRGDLQVFRRRFSCPRWRRRYREGSCPRC